MGLKAKGSAYCTLKYAFISCNILLWLFGCGLLAVGVWIHVNQAAYAVLLPNVSFYSATALTITAAVILFVLGFSGCLGAILESQCVLVVYVIFAIVIFGLEVAAFALCLSNQDKIQKYLHEEVLLSMHRDYNPSVESPEYEGVVAVVDAIQTNFECCGIDNQTDWYYISAWPDKQNVPWSCCANPKEGCGEAGSRARIYSRGCLGEVKYWLLKNMYTLGLLGLGVAVIQVLLVTAAITLYCCVRKKPTNVC